MSVNDANVGRASRRADEPLPLYEFATVGDLLLGWQVHAVRQWRIHEETARRLTWWHYILGVPAVALVALAGTTAARDHTSVAPYLAACATVLVAVQTFLNFGARAETNRLSAAAYKRLVRRLERLPPSQERLSEITDAALSTELNALATELAETDAAAPTPLARVARVYDGRTFARRDHVPLAVESSDD